METEDSLKSVSEQFSIEGNFTASKAIGNGHINDTYLIETDSGRRTKKYVLQRINHHIFKNVDELMENIVRVTEHIKMQSELEGDDCIEGRELEVICTKSQRNYFRCQKGNYWRMYNYIADTCSYDVPEKIDQIYEAAGAFGRFQRHLANLPAPPLHETIPDFHNGLKRYRDFTDALEKDLCQRAEAVRHEIDFIVSHKTIFQQVADLIEQGRLPIRITHNDTKVNNVLIDNKTGRGICVIDLDTVMPGLVLYDFGDLVRTTVSPTEEDEQDLSKIFIDRLRFEAIAEGFLAQAGCFLTAAERATLYLGGQMLTLIMATRFLADYLAGDTYYKTHRPGHNLDRCKTQIRLVELLEEQKDDLLSVIN